MRNARIIPRFGILALEDHRRKTFRRLYFNDFRDRVAIDYYSQWLMKANVYNGNFSRPTVWEKLDVIQVVLFY